MENTEIGLHIGHLIQEQLRKDKRSVGWLAREIHCTRNNVYKIFSKASLDSDLILTISKALQFNFFQYYTAEFLESMKNRLGEEA
jgi:plasmid maintenance system antidote protein VapI